MINIIELIGEEILYNFHETVTMSKWQKIKYWALKK